MHSGNIAERSREYTLGALSMHITAMTFYVPPNARKKQSLSATTTTSRERVSAQLVCDSQKVTSGHPHALHMGRVMNPISNRKCLKIASYINALLLFSGGNFLEKQRNNPPPQLPSSNSFPMHVEIYPNTLGRAGRLLGGRRP